MNDHVAKPINVDRLIQVLVTQLAGQRGGEEAEDRQ